MLYAKLLTMDLEGGNNIMKKPVGEEDFDEIRRNRNYYVDKTEVIYDLLNSSVNKVTLFTRPQRFGKTFALSMMESFFDIGRDSQDVFQELDMLKNHQEFCHEWIESCH